MWCTCLISTTIRKMWFKHGILCSHLHLSYKHKIIFCVTVFVWFLLQVQNDRIGVFNSVFNVQILDNVNYIRHVNGNTIADVYCVRCGMLLGLKFGEACLLEWYFNDLSRTRWKHCLYWPGSLWTRGRLNSSCSTKWTCECWTSSNESKWTWVLDQLQWMKMEELFMKLLMGWAIWIWMAHLKHNIHLFEFSKFSTSYMLDS